MPSLRDKTSIAANATIENILADLRIRNVPLNYPNGALISFSCLVGVAGNQPANPGYSRPELQAFIGSDQVVEKAVPGTIVTGTYGNQSRRPSRLGPNSPTDTLFAGEGALPGDLIRIQARGTGTAVTLLWLLDVQEVV